jgi:large subunit ribosomal protein L31e
MGHRQDHAARSHTSQETTLEKKQLREINMADTERVYTIPLGKVKSAPIYRRSNRAMTEVRSYLAKHMKVAEDEVKIDPGLNEVIWARGDMKPPLRVRVRAVKFEDGGVEAEFAGDR